MDIIFMLVIFWEIVRIKQTKTKKKKKRTLFYLGKQKGWEKKIQYK